MEELLKIRDLSFFTGNELLFRIPEWTLHKGEFVLLSGPTGGGKTTLAKWLSGQLPDYCRTEGAGLEIYTHFRETHRPLYLLQDAYTIFNPYVSIGRHLGDVWQAQKEGSAFRSRDEILEFLRRSGLHPDPSFLRRKVHQISQGEAQRCALILSLIRPSGLLILDEVFSNVDFSARLLMMDILRDWQKRTGLTVLFISHDIEFASSYVSASYTIEDRIMTENVKQPIKMPETKPVLRPNAVLLEIRELQVFEPGFSRQKERKLLWSMARFYCLRGECLGFTGASGMGKTTFLLDLAGAWKNTTWEQLLIEGKESQPPFERGFPDVRYLPQSVVSAFNPVRKIRKSVEEIRKAHGASRQELDWLMDAFQLNPALANRYPEEVSGGEMQRFGVISVLLGRPDLILFDESFSAVDFAVREKIWEVIREYQARLGFSVIVVSHDERWLERNMDRVVVGRCVSQ